MLSGVRIIPCTVYGVRGQDHPDQKIVQFRGQDNPEHMSLYGYISPFVLNVVLSIVHFKSVQLFPSFVPNVVLKNTSRDLPFCAFLNNNKHSFGLYY